MTMPSLAGFVCASALFTLSPGPDNLFIIAQGLSRGRRAAIAAGMGMCSGVTVHTLAVSLGLAALFASSAAAFDAVRWAGAAYLLFLALRVLKAGAVVPESGGGREAGNGTTRQSTAAMFRRGFVMNVLNPKVALFFLAFLPQFTQADSAVPFRLQIIVLGLVFMGQAVVIFAFIGFFAGSIGNRILESPRLSKLFNAAAGMVFAGLGLRLLFLRR